MSFSKNIFVYLLLTMVLPLCFSCNKNLITTSSSAKLSFQTDTVKFDTVFTSLGSATQSLKIYNPNSEKINISNIRLAGGTGSMFRINVDGTPTYSIDNVQIAAHDSLYIFVAVTVDPSNVNNPFVVNDSILFSTNGNDQKVILDAYGQNAHYYNDSVVCDEDWVADKPYVIFNSIEVNPGCTLTIEKGARVYMHYGSNILVAGTLIVGPGATVNDSVVFQVDRLEQDYAGIPGQWGSIWFLRGSTGYLTHAIINEATTGIFAGIGGTIANDTLVSTFTNSSAPSITLNQCIIQNCLNYGINGVYSTITANNTLITSCGMDDLFLLYGGNYNFSNCTLVDFSSSTTNHTNPIVALQNFYPQNKTNYVASFNTNFYNTIVFGDISNGNEIFDTVLANTTSNLLFQNCFVTVTNTPASNYTNCLVNKLSQPLNPLFINSTNNNFFLMSGSPCIGSGEMSSEVSPDLDDQTRIINQPDIGCYSYPQ